MGIKHQVSLSYAYFRARAKAGKRNNEYLKGEEP